MCGILAVFGPALPTPEQIKQSMLALLARGPEFNKIETHGSVILGFTRLAINGLTKEGHQPIIAEDMAVICNGEIYNYRELAKRWNIDLSEGSSDCQILPHLFRKLGPSEACRALDGVFALVVVDFKNQSIIVARDPYGVRPLFMARAEGFQAFASEMKALTPFTDNIQVFPPSTWYKFNMPKPGGQEIEVMANTYHHTPWLKNPLADDFFAAKYLLNRGLTAAVEKRLMSDRPLGALLSGGLDSSLVCAIAARTLSKLNKKLSTFSIGMPGSTDLLYARKVAEHIKSDHHEITLTTEDFFNAIPEVIKAAETFDITSVRASVGNYLVGKFIKDNTDIKVVFNGDGSDEIGGGYLYFHRAPSDEEFESESMRLLRDIHAFDVLRSDRAMASHGLEARTPFLDRQLVAVWRSLPTKLLRPTKEQPEKFILRSAFDQDNLLPSEVLWRKKEAFSDGVSATEKPWHASINEWARTQIPDIDDKLASAEQDYPHCTPKTAEALLYRRIFEEHYGKKAALVIPYFWMPKWSPETTDPSARTLSLY